MAAILLPGAVNDEAGEEDDEEVVGVPKDLKVAAADDLHGRRDNEDEAQGDDDPRDARDGGEHQVSGNLLRILTHKNNFRSYVPSWPLH